MQSIFDDIDLQKTSYQDWQFNSLTALEQTLEIEGIRYNPFSYALKKNNFQAFKALIDISQKQNPPFDFGKTLLFTHLFGESQTYFVDLFSPMDEKRDFLHYFIDQANLNDREKMNLLALFLTTFKNSSTFFEPLIDEKLIKKQWTYNDLMLIHHDKEFFSLFANKYIHLNEQTSLTYFKDYINHFNDYESNITLSNLDSLLDGFKEMSLKMDEVVNQSSSISELEKAFSKEGAIYNIKKHYQPILDEFSLIAQNNSVSIYYLLDDPYFKKYCFYSHSIYHENKDDIKPISEVIKDVFFNDYLNRRLNDVEADKKAILQTLLSEYQFKAMTVSKHIDVENVRNIIIEGTDLVQKTYQLKPEEVGGNNLCLKFTHQGGGHAGLASYALGTNLITHYYVNHNENSSDDINHLKRHFLHEYTHYLQDLKYHAYDLMVDKENLYQNTDFGDIEQNIDFKNAVQGIFSYEASQDNAFECSFKIIHYYLPEVDKASVQTFFNTQFNQGNYANALKEYFNSHSDVNVDNENQKNNILNSIVSYLVLIEKGYQSKHFSQTIWQELDAQNGSIYFMNPFEIHSRLVETMSEVGMEQLLSHSGAHFYPTKEAINVARPHLEKFNALLIDNYRSMMVDKNKQIQHLILKDKILSNREANTNHNSLSQLEI